MLDIKLLRNEPEKIQQSLKRRKEKISVQEVLDLDEKRRNLLFDVEKLKNQRNETSRQIPTMKKEGKNISDLLEEMKVVSETIKEYDIQIRETDEKIGKIMLTIPNVPHESVPDGDSDEDNVEVRRWGEVKEFDFNAKAHWDIGEDLDILDFTTAAKITGARFTVYKGLGARLERAVINFFLDIHTQENGYLEILPPFIVNRDSMVGTGQLPKFEEDAFKLTDSDYFLIPTAEVPVTNMYKGQTLEAKQLPIKHVAYSACFRAEAGAAGRDTRGLIRQHQFNKVELVKFVEPESSYDELEKLTRDAEKVLQLLEIPYRVVKICIGDLGFAAAMKYDIEVWMPSYNRYVEISSCSNFEEFQARRANIKYREKAGEKPKFVHTLNGSGVAVGRAVASILENFQNEDGTVTIPKVLRGYMGGATSIIKR